MRDRYHDIRTSLSCVILQYYSASVSSVVHYISVIFFVGGKLENISSLFT